VGGSGKTPLAGEVARMLLDMGERPAILSRGYAREHPSDGVVIVSDGNGLNTDVAHAGDEPFMLAQAVPRAAVLVCASRYLAGRVAESQLGCTVHILDDGFQHFQLMHDIDLLVAPDEAEPVRTLPFGRFREPLDAATAADALLVPEASDVDLSTISGRLGVNAAFGFSRSLGEPRTIGGTPKVSPEPTRAFAFAGIARPERFYGDLERSGWQLSGRRSFPDHHPYSRREIEDVTRRASDSGAEIILTTEKDAVRMPSRHGGLPIASVPLQISLEPEFGVWLRQRLLQLRAA
jgi:tetraacyldisaccharide 4'-kinase